MTRILLALMLALASTHASANGWPWQTSTGGEPLDYCRGFLAGGLASNEVADMSRVDLWLAWNYMIQSGPLGQGPDGKEYQAGLKHFQTVAADTAAQSVIHQADGECGLGRSGHQITGW
jgi:hypothetical protein